MAKKIIVNVIPEEIRMALCEDGRLLEVAVERAESDYMVGNIYKGRVENVLPGMQSAFINIGIGKNAFLYAGDIFPHKSFQRLVEEDNLTVGAEIMVEIVKDAMGTKGPRATTHFSIPGRYVVVMPSVDYVGVSRRIESGEERSRLRALAEKIRPKGMGVIVRTVAEGHTEEELARDFQYLSNLWSALTAKAKRAKAPFLLYRDADLLVRILRDHVKDDIEEVVVDDAEAHARMVELAKFLSPDLVKKIHLYKAKTEIFSHYALEDEWNRLADRRVDLKCGGYLVIDRTEALTVIDVNTGRFIGHSNLADTVFRANMEAAAEIARQLRLRDIGGIIVADFIDMQKESHKKAILTELEARLKADNTKTNVLGLTELGLVEMTRKKARQTYESTLYEGCPCCNGRGIIQSPDTVVIAIRRQLRRIAAKRPGADLVLQMHPRIVERFGDKKAVAALAKELGVELTLEPLAGLQVEVFSILEGSKTLAHSHEAKKIRKPALRRGHSGGEEADGGQEPLSEEELAPLLAETFAMDASVSSSSTLESRLTAMAGLLWEPLIETEEEERAAGKTGEAAETDETGAAEEAAEGRPKRTRRRRSKKMLMSEITEKAGTAPGAEAAPVPAAGPGTGPAAEPGAEPAAATVKKKRGRKPKKAPAADAQEATAPAGEAVPAARAQNAGELPAEQAEAAGQAEAAEAATEAVPGEAAAAPAKKKRRRRRRKKPAGAAAETPEMAEIPDAAESEEPEEAEELAESLEDGAAAAAAPAKKKRRRRRKKPAGRENGGAAEAAGNDDAAGETAGEPAVETSDATTDEPDGEPAGEESAAEAAVKKPKRKRRRKKKTAAEPSAEGTAGETAAAEVPEETPGAEDTAGAEETGEAAPAKKKRRRRRSNGKKKPAAAAEAPTDPVAPD